MLGKFPNRFKVAMLFLSLARVAGGFGLWVIFQRIFSIVFDYHTCNLQLKAKTELVAIGTL